MSLYLGKNHIGQVSVAFKGNGGDNTSDATLTSGNQMLKSVTAYSKGKKYTGTIPTKTASDIVVDKNTVTIPYGYYSEEYIKTIAEAVVATPTISVSNTGLITASTNQTTGYVNGATKNATQQLTTKSGTTIIPTDSEQIVVNAGTYVTGDIKVAAVEDNSLDTSDATATADEIFSEKTAYVNGEKITGNFTITEEVSDQKDVIAQIQSALEGKAIGGGGVTVPELSTVTYEADTPVHINYMTIENNSLVKKSTSTTIAGTTSGTIKVIPHSWLYISTSPVSTSDMWGLEEVYPNITSISFGGDPSFFSHSTDHSIAVVDAMGSAHLVITTDVISL